MYNTGSLQQRYILSFVFANNKGVIMRVKK